MLIWKKCKWNHQVIEETDICCYHNARNGFTSNWAVGQRGPMKTPNSPGNCQAKAIGCSLQTGDNTILLKTMSE